MPPRRIKLPLKRNAQARVPPRSKLPSDDEEIAAKKAKVEEKKSSNARSGSDDKAGKKKKKQVLPNEGGGLSSKAVEFHRVKRELLSVVFVELALRGLQRRAEGSDENVSGMED